MVHDIVSSTMQALFLCIIILCKDAFNSVDGSYCFAHCGRIMYLMITNFLLASYKGQDSIVLTLLLLNASYHLEYWFPKKIMQCHGISTVQHFILPSNKLNF